VDNDIATVVIVFVHVLTDYLLPATESFDYSSRNEDEKRAEERKGMEEARVKS